ncbi:claudin-19-like [Styela clava]|uniref:claudin-19-like n=1 Tax=Styela clava TaxID=7725 RepID=UPI00193AAD4E|nr:claudin-19-like [Styela clava]
MSANEIVCVCFIAIGFIGVIIAIANPAWEKSDLQSLATPTSQKYKGLWLSCKSDSSIRVSCWPYIGFFAGIDVKIQAARACCIAALAFSLFSLILCLISVTGMPCANEYESTRNRIRLAGSGLGFAGGLCMVVGASWYAASTLNEYYRLVATNPGSERLVIGVGVFIAWGAGLFLNIGGIFGACISCRNEEDDVREMPRRMVTSGHIRGIEKEYV